MHEHVICPLMYTSVLEAITQFILLKEAKYAYL